MARDYHEFDVFLSYASEDEDVVRELASRLRNDGLRVWTYRDNLDSGQVWREHIAKLLERVPKFVLCMSESWFRSDWTQEEARLFNDLDPPNERGGFIVIRLDDTAPESWLKQFFYYDWWPETQDTVYPELLRLCRGQAKPRRARSPLFRGGGNGWRRRTVPHVFAGALIFLGLFLGGCSGGFAWGELADDPSGQPILDALLGWIRWLGPVCCTSLLWMGTYALVFTSVALGLSFKSLRVHGPATAPAIRKLQQHIPWIGVDLAVLLLAGSLAGAAGALALPQDALLSRCTLLAWAVLPVLLATALAPTTRRLYERHVRPLFVPEVDHGQ